MLDSDEIFIGSINDIETPIVIVHMEFCYVYIFFTYFNSFVIYIKREREKERVLHENVKWESKRKKLITKALDRSQWAEIDFKHNNLRLRAFFLNCFFNLSCLFQVSCCHHYFHSSLCQYSCCFCPNSWCCPFNSNKNS